MAKAADGLTPEQFSSPVLGQIYGVLLCQFVPRPAPATGGAGRGAGGAGDYPAGGDFGPASRPAKTAPPAMADYRAVIETEQMKRENDTDEAVLLAARDNYRKKKSI